jgi:hypothetical protein
VIFDERPKPFLLQKLGWFRENAEQIPILAYIPTHLLYKKTMLAAGPLDLEAEEKVMPFNNVWDSTVLTTNGRLLRSDGFPAEGTEAEDVTPYDDLNTGEKFIKLISSMVGCIALTDQGRLFSWGSGTDAGTWTTTYNLRSIPQYTTDNNIVEINQDRYNQYFDYDEGNIIVDIFAAGGTGGAFALMNNGKVYSWGRNINGVLFRPTSVNGGLYEFRYPLDITAYIELNEGEQVERIEHSKYPMFFTSDNRMIMGRVLSDNPVAIEPISEYNWTSILGTGNYITGVNRAFNYLIANDGKIFYRNFSNVLYDRTSYFEALLNEGEVLVKFLREDAENLDSTADASYVLTSQNRVLAFGSNIIGDDQTASITAPIVLNDNGIELDAEFEEYITDIKVHALQNEYNNFNDNGWIAIHTNLGKMTVYPYGTPTESTEYAGVMGLAVQSETLLNGEVMQDLVKTGDSDEYILKELKITRGAILDVFYDFAPDKLNKFYVADVKTDLVSINYIANLVPYKYDADKEAEEDQNTSNGEYLDFNSDEYGI